MKDKTKIKELIHKYNDVLLESIKIALAEDLRTLIIVNNEDKNFDLVNFIKNKNEFKDYVQTEFLKYNTQNPLKNLSKMEEMSFNLKK